MNIKIAGPNAGDSLDVTVTSESGSRRLAVTNWLRKPGALTVTDWGIDETLEAETAAISVTAASSDATSYQARINSGTPFTFTPGGVTNAGFVANTQVSVQIRGVRTSDDYTVFGEWSDTKTFTASDGLIDPPGANQWVVSDTGAGGSVDLSFSLAPHDLDDLAIAYGYTIGSTDPASIVALSDGATATTITGLTNTVEVSVRVWVRNAAGDWGPASDPKLVTPTDVTPVPAPGTYGTGDWSIANGGSGTNAIISVTAHPTDAATVQYDVGASGTWIDLGGLSASYVISGLTEGVEASIRLRALNINSLAGSASTAKTVTPAAISSGEMTAGMWTLNDEPSPGGDTANVIILSTPVVADREVIGYEAEINGSSVQYVPFGHYETQMDLSLTQSALPHSIRVPASATDVRIRPILRQVSAPPSKSIDRIVERGGWSDTKSVTPTVGTATLTLQATRTTIRQYEGVMLRAILTGSGALNRFADPYFEWDFGEDAGTFDTMAADFPGSKSASVQLGGWVAAHQFRTVGEKTVTCTARYKGQTISQTITITVNAWANNIVYIASDGTGDYTSMLAAMTALPPTTERQYLLKRGNTFADDRLSAGLRDVTAPCLIGTYGSGAKPIITDTLGNKNFRVRIFAPLVIMDMDMRSKYIIETPSANSGVSPGSAIDVNADAGSGFTASGIEAVGYNETISGGGVNLVFSNCKVTNWFNFGFGAFGDSGNIAFVGCSARQNPLAYNDKVPKSWQAPYVPLHGPHRTSRIDGANVYYALDFASFNGWSSNTAHQPGFRWGTGGEFTEFLIEGYFGNIRLEGGQLGTAAGTTGAKIYSAAKLWENVYHVSTMQEGVSLGHGGEVMRNVIAVVPNTPPEGNAESHFISLRRWTSTRLEEPVSVYNCTFVDLRSSTNADGKSFSLINATDPRFSLFNETNNVIHAPNGISGGPTTDAPLDMSSAWTPLYLGRRITTENGGATQTQFGHATTDAPIARPQTGSAAIADATGDLIAYRDFYGNVRGGSPSRGAIEPV